MTVALYVCSCCGDPCAVVCEVGHFEDHGVHGTDLVIEDELCIDCMNLVYRPALAEHGSSYVKLKGTINQ